MSKSKSPIFLVGQQRSGTTLFTAMMSAHSRIGIAPETAFFRHWWAIRHWYGDLSDSDRFEVFWKDYTTVGRFPHLGLDADALKKRLVNENDGKDYASIYAHTLSAYAEENNKVRWGNKVPYFSVQQVLDWYPDALVIYIVRDPRAVHASILKTPWGSKNVVFQAESWSQMLKSFHGIKDRERVMMVSYESLVASPEQELGRVCDFIGEDFEPDMVDGRSEKSSPVVSKREGWAKTHLESAVKKPVSVGSVEKWRGDLSKFDIAAIEHVLRNEMLKQGYKCDTDRFQFGQAVFWYLYILPKWRISQAIQTLNTTFRQAVRKLVPFCWMRTVRGIVRRDTSFKEH